MGINYCSEKEILQIRDLFSEPRDVDIRPLYTYLCPVIILICFFSVIFNAILMGISRQSKVVNKSPILLLSLNLAVTDLIASLMNGLNILFNSYLPEVHGRKTSQCWMLIFEVIRCAALVASALHLLALAIVHYRGIVDPLHYRSTIFFSQHLSRTINIISIVCWIIPLTIMLVEFSTTPCQGFTFRYILLTSFALPLIVMVVIYLRIFTIISRLHKGRRVNTQSERESTLAQGVLKASAPVGSAAAMNLPKLMGPTKLPADAGPGHYDQQQDEARACSVCGPKGGQKQDGATTLGSGNRSTSSGGDEAEESSGSSSSSSQSTLTIGESDQTGALAAAAAADIKFSYSTRSRADAASPRRIAVRSNSIREVGAEDGLVVDRGQQISNHEKRKEEGEKIHYSNCDHSGLSTFKGNDYRKEANEDEKGENLLVSQLVTGIVPAGTTTGLGPKLGTKIVNNKNNKHLCDQTSNKNSNNKGEAADSTLPSLLGEATRSQDNVNDGLDKGLTMLADSGAPRATSKFVALPEGEDLCCPTRGVRPMVKVAAAAVAANFAIGGDSSVAMGGQETAAAAAVGSPNPSRSDAAAADTRRSDSCKGRPPRTTLRTQFSLGAQLLGPPTSPRLKSQQLQKQPSKSSLKWSHSRQQQHLSIVQKDASSSTSSGGEEINSRESTWECNCDNKLRQSARSNILAGQLSPVAAKQTPDIYRGQGTLVTMSITGQVDSQVGSSSMSLSTNAVAAHMSKENPSSSRRPPKLGSRSMTSGGGGGGGDTCKSKIAGRLNQSIECNISRQHSSYNGGSAANYISRAPATPNLSSTAGGSYYEPQRKHFHASAVPQTKTKAIVTTLLILGTYFISYVPAILFQALTCIDHPICPFPLYILPFSRRVFFGSITTVLVIAKSIIDPLIYSYRMSEVQEAINHYLSKRRSKSSMANSMLRTSQRFHQPQQARTSLHNNYNNNNSTANNNNNNNNNYNNFRTNDSRAATTTVATATNSGGSAGNGNQKATTGLQLDGSGSLRILKQRQNNGCYNSKATISTTTSCSDDSPSRLLARRFQSFDKYELSNCPTINSSPAESAERSPLKGGQVQQPASCGQAQTTEEPEKISMMHQPVAGRKCWAQSGEEETTAGANFKSRKIDKLEADERSHTNDDDEEERTRLMGEPIVVGQVGGSILCNGETQ